MDKYKIINSIINIISKVILVVAIVALLVPAWKNNIVSAAATGDKVDIVFTSDLHSFVESYLDDVNGEVKNVAGFARLKTFIDSKRAENPDTLIVDCGDIVMGSFPHALMDTEAVELRLASQFGYDAITYGNHEFDFGAQALADMYSITAEREQSHPAFVNCNIDWTQNDEYTNTLRAGMEKYGYSDYVIVQKGDVKIAITGCLGIDAIKCAPTCELTFIDYIEAVKNTVNKIKATENPDMIVCLSHSGTGNNLGETEDEVLAKEVPDIDVIVSGHTHTLLKEVVTVGDTHIASCKAYGKFTGDLSLTRNSSGRWDLMKYNMQLMDESIEEDPAVLARVEEINELVDNKVLKDYGYKSQQVIATTDIEFEPYADSERLHEELRLCNLLSDSYRYSANITPTGQEKQFDIAVVPSGTVRDTIYAGNITVKDSFDVLSLGIGPDGNVGYPLVSLYLTGKEIRTISEVDASISDLMTTARLYTSGLAMEYNPKRMILNKLVDVWLAPALLEESYAKLENDKLYRVVTDSYSMSMLGAVTDMSKGLLSVVPKDEDGNAITDPLQCIIYDKDGNELKSWIALSGYMESFSKNEQGISVIPDYYRTTHNRKVVNDSLSFRALFKNTSKFLYIVIAIIMLIILLIFIIIRSIVKSIHKKKVFK